MPRIVLRVTMGKQLGKNAVYGSKPADVGGLDLNCGWYCYNAARGYHGIQPFPHPKSYTYGFDPLPLSKDVVGALGSVVELEKPKCIEVWFNVLSYLGPIIVSGKLGSGGLGPS